jgi:molybdate transport system regulatory protein
MFTVPDSVRRLTSAEMARLGHAFEKWATAARDRRTRRSRERMVLLFWVLRHTGARLGEVLGLDKEHVDWKRGVAHFGNGEGDMREVPLPVWLLERLAASVDEDPAPGSLFRLDQGFVRRKFYEQARASDIPKDMLNPRVLRNSRAVELLQGGMPLHAVQALLGHSTVEFASSYVTIAEKDLQSIIEHHLAKENVMETSARNTFTGPVVKVTTTGLLSEIILRTPSGYEVVSIITNESREKLGLVEGRTATALIKATLVLLEAAPATGPTPSSARNAFVGTVANVASDGTVAEISGALDDGTPVCALVTEASRKSLGIEKGKKYVWFFKAMNVIVS